MNESGISFISHSWNLALALGGHLDLQNLILPLSTIFEGQVCAKSVWEGPRKQQRTCPQTVSCETCERCLWIQSTVREGSSLGRLSEDAPNPSLKTIQTLPWNSDCPLQAAWLSRRRPVEAARKRRYLRQRRHKSWRNQENNQKHVPRCWCHARIVHLLLVDTWKSQSLQEKRSAAGVHSIVVLLRRFSAV